MFKIGIFLIFSYIFVIILINEQKIVCSNPLDCNMPYKASRSKPLRKFYVFGYKAQNECSKMLRLLQEKELNTRKELERENNRNKANKIDSVLQTNKMLAYMKDFYGPRYF